MVSGDALYGVVVGVTILQRLFELALARSNLSWLLERGGQEVGAGHYRWMVGLHTAFLISCVLEPWLLDRPFNPLLAAAMISVLALATILRSWTIATLGRRWTTRVVVVPGAPLVSHGPYRFLRHPNYLAVMLEITALPLVHGAWLTSLVFSLLNIWLLTVRISVEERALTAAQG